jgi:hypothetical protein
MVQLVVMATKTQNVGFLGCLLMALILVLTQAWVSTHPSTPLSDDAKKALKDAADQVTDAADETEQAANAAADVHAKLTGADEKVVEQLGGAELMRSAGDKVDGAKQKAAGAKQKAAEAKDKAEKATGLTDVVNTLASKLPLLGGALVFVLIGAWVAGFAKVTFGG